MAAPQQYSLRWNNYFRHLTYALDNHRVNDDFVDVSLLCDGRKIKAHKVVLSACSSYFKEIFTENPHPHPVIIFKFIKYEDLNSIIEFMYQGEVNVQQEALQSFLQTAELLAVQGLTAEEKEKPKPPSPIMDDHKLIKSIPSTIRAVNDTSAATQTIDIPMLQSATQLQIPSMQPQSTQQQQQTSVQSQQPATQHHQVQHIQVHQNTQSASNTYQVATHQVSTSAGQTHQQIEVQHQVHAQLQQQQHQHQVQSQQVQINTQPSTLTTNIVTQPGSTCTAGSNKKRKITFSDDDDNIYTTEAVDEQTLVKTADMTLLRGTLKMDIPEYIVAEVDDPLSDTGGTQGNNQDSGSGGQNVTQYTSEYEILTESEIDEKYQHADNAEITIEMGRLLNPSSSGGQNPMDDATSGSNMGLKGDKNVSPAATKYLICKICKRKLNSPNALRRHIASKHTKIMGKEFDCTVCHKGFKTKWSLSTHTSRFHRDMKPAREYIKMDLSSNLMYKYK